MVYPAPGTEGSTVEVLTEYGNFIGGEFQAPVDEEYADNPTPVTGKAFTRYAQSTEPDVEAALGPASIRPQGGRTERRTDRLRSAAPGLLFGGGLSDLTFVVAGIGATLHSEASTGRRAPWAS